MDDKKLRETLEKVTIALRAAVPSGMVCSLVLYEVSTKRYLTAGTTDKTGMIHMFEEAIEELKTNAPEQPPRRD